jgi:glutathione S-transferase
MWGVEITSQREDELEQFFEQGYRALSVMERHLSDRAFFVGDRLTVADVALYVYPSVAYEGGFDLESYPAVSDWLDRVAALPGYVPLKPPG